MTLPKSASILDQKSEQCCCTYIISQKDRLPETKSGVILFIRKHGHEAKFLAKGHLIWGWEPKCWVSRWGCLTRTDVKDWCGWQTWATRSDLNCQIDRVSQQSKPSGKKAISHCCHLLRAAKWARNSLQEKYPLNVWWGSGEALQGC